MTTFDKTAAEALLKSAPAPWVQDLDLSIENLTADGAVLRMRFSEKLCRDNGVVCGQALMSFADTAMIIAVAAAAGGYFPMTTVDQTIHFMRPAMRADVLAEARIVRMGKTMAYGSVSIRTDADERPVAMAQTAYALLREAK
ncbi:PaaI family thioesterase [soil metagenome]